MKNKKVLIFIPMLIIIGISALIIVNIQNKATKKISNISFQNNSNIIDNKFKENNEINVNEIVESKIEEINVEETENKEITENIEQPKATESYYKEEYYESIEEIQKTTNKETKAIETTKIETTEQVVSTPQVEEDKTPTITCEDIHKNLKGNCNIWFSSQGQAVEYYNKLVADKDKEIQEKIKQQTNAEDRDRVYREETLKCPYGYELITCPICNKWTLNMYYR